jgi:predicted kinase
MRRKILIMGLPGAGKTTLATVLAPLLNAVVFNADAVRFNLSRALALVTKIASSTRVAWAGCVIGWLRPAVR